MSHYVTIISASAIHNTHVYSNAGGAFKLSLNKSEENLLFNPIILNLVSFWPPCLFALNLSNSRGIGLKIRTNPDDFFEDYFNVVYG